MPFYKSEFGIGYKATDHEVFFGAHSCNQNILTALFPDTIFCRIRQTHSAIVVEASETVLEADAHFSASPKTVLVVATADCVPLMIYCKQTKRVAAVHAGWRGVNSKITVNVLAQLVNSGSSLADFIFYIGPHIHQASFETDSDVFETLKSSHPGLEAEKFSQSNNSKHFISLSELIRYQIEQFIKKEALIFDVSVDTKQDPDFHSYRRDKAASGRNLNIILRL